MPSKQRVKSQKRGKEKSEDRGSVATLPETPDLLTGDEGQGSVETADVVSTTPEVSSARVVESPTAEVPVAVAETVVTDGEPKIKSSAQKKWREKNRGKVQDYQKKWREKNKDKVKEIHANYRKKNPEKVKEWQKASQSRRKDKAAAEKTATEQTTQA